MCTGIYIGKKVCKEGTTIIARSCDHADDLNMTTTILCSPHKQPKSKTYLKSYLTGRAYQLPKVQYKCLMTPTIPNEIGSLTCIGANEHGLAVTGTVTAYSSKKIKKLDPLQPKGLSEDVVAGLIGISCKTAREGIVKIGECIEKFGNYEENSIMLADQNEAWYIELYTGHQWAAIKMPEDKIAIYGNEFMIQAEYEKDNPDEFLHSKDLFNLPEKSGLAVYTNGKMNIVETYVGHKNLADYANLRTYFGHYLFDTKNPGKYQTKKRYSLFMNPKKKIGLNDIFELLRYQFEGTQYGPDSKDFDKRRLFGTVSQLCTHALQVYDNYPKDMCIVPWIALSNCEHTVHLPYSNLQTKVHKEYEYFDWIKYLNGKKTPILFNDRPLVYSDNVAAICYQKLAYLAETDRSAYGSFIRKFWKKKEQKMQKDILTVLDKTYKLYKKNKKDAIKYINNYTYNIENESLAETKALFDELLWYVMGNTDTLKYHFDYDKLAYEKKRLEPKPFKPTFFFLDKYIKKSKC